MEAVLQKALAKNPDERFQSGRALVEALAEALAGGQALGYARQDMATVAAAGDGRTAVVMPPVPRANRRTPLLIAGAAGLLVLLLAGGAVFPLTRPGADPTPAANVGATATAQGVAVATATGQSAAAQVAAATGTAGANATAAAGAPSPTPVPTATPAPPTPTAAPTSAPTPTVTAAAPQPQPLGGVPPDWQVYRGSSATLPLVIAYPPGWTVDAKKGSVEFLWPGSVAGQGAALTIFSVGVPMSGANADASRDRLWESLKKSCTSSGVERTGYTDFAGLRFATLHATCDDKGWLLLFSVGAGLKEDVEWDYFASSAYEIFDDYGARYFDPMLQSLNIYANP